MRVRAFFCLELEEAVQEQLAECVRPLRRIPAKVNWVAAPLLHVTVRFLGEVDPDRVPDLRRAAGQAASGIGGFSLDLDRLGAFPTVERPRVIWAGCSQEPPQILQLHDALEARLAELGFPPDDKAFHPHVTLGRVKERDRALIRTLAQRLSALSPPACHVPFGGLTLMQSVLTPQGPEYTPLAQVSF